MKKCTLLLLLFLLFSSLNVSAQGWQWGVSPKFISAVPEMGGFFEGPMAVDVSGNVFIAGSTFNLNSCIFGSDTIIPYRNWISQVVVAKADSIGSFLWAIGTKSKGQSFPVGIAANSSGCLYLLGTYSGDSICIIGPDTLRCAAAAGITNSVFYLAKIDPIGNVLWAKNCVIPQGNAHVTSGISYIGPNGGIGLDDAGNIYITSSFATPSVSIDPDTLVNADVTAGSYDFFVAKFDSSGTPLWANRYGGTNSDYENSIAVTPSGNVYLAGSYLSPSMTLGSATLINAGSANNFFVAKFDTYGNPRWAKNITGNPISTNDAEGLAIDPAESVYFTGGFRLNAITFGSLTLPHSGDESLFIVKYDSSGNVKWAKTASSLQSCGYGISADNCGNIWTCGQMAATMNFSGHTLHAPSNSYIPVYVVQYDTAGNYINGTALQNGGGAYSNLLVDNMGHLFIGGLYNTDSNLFKFYIGPDTLTVDSQYQNLFVARYVYGGPDGCRIDSFALVHAPLAPGYNISLFPNPAYNECTIHSESTFSPGSNAELYDLAGRLINTYPLSGNNTEIPLTNLSPGIYQCRIHTTGNASVTKKLVIMK